MIASSPRDSFRTFEISFIHAAMDISVPFSLFALNVDEKFCDSLIIANSHLLFLDCFWRLQILQEHHLIRDYFLVNRISDSGSNSHLSTHN